MIDRWLALCRAFYTLPARQLWGRVLLGAVLLSSALLTVAGGWLAWDLYQLRRHLAQGAERLAVLRVQSLAIDAQLGLAESLAASVRRRQTSCAPLVQAALAWQTQPDGRRQIVGEMRFTDLIPLLERLADCGLGITSLAVSSSPHGVRVQWVEAQE
ncbi:mammalian cell entry protein [Edwardsiella hoshinae]|uniref:Mammalian cell entry protein n=1 Tax=Edwardsiella hoshinae TaxID=93378 RepID=A0ABM6EFE5_9GAMM|nr:mammalian cell entry protein [Edwardsiella hoshinae]AOV95677.1 mammalian cell entry protein [Edwardsiella hoshinae]